jgi:hypothetical protein
MVKQLIIKPKQQQRGAVTSQYCICLGLKKIFSKRSNGSRLLAKYRCRQFPWLKKMTRNSYFFPRLNRVYFSMYKTPQHAHTLEEVIERLAQIIELAKKENDRGGYFAALYHKVTVKVKEGVDKGQFANGESLARLDIMFANRYFDALEQWQNKQKGKAWLPVSKSWETAFSNLNNSSRLVLHHLLLGMNAHINLDLGIATVEVADGNIDSLRNDFDAINMILSSLTYGVMNKLNMVSPLLSILGFSGTKSNSMLIQFSMGNARDGSWCFAENLAAKYTEPAAYQQLILQRDTEIAELGTSLTNSSGVLRVVIWLIHVLEWKNVKRIIVQLGDYKKPYKKEMSAGA